MKFKEGDKVRVRSHDFFEEFSGRPGTIYKVHNNNGYTLYTVYFEDSSKIINGYTLNYYVFEENNLIAISLDDSNKEWSDLWDKLTD